MITRLMTKAMTRRCDGCPDESPHDAHLTWFGRLRLWWWGRGTPEATDE